MKKWKHQVKMPKGRDGMKAGIFDVIEHTDKECSKKRTDGKFLAPRSVGFVCLYQKGTYIGWCGVFYAERHIINPIKKDSKKYNKITIGCHPSTKKSLEIRLKK